MRNLTRSFRRELPNAKTLSQKVAAILRKYGTDAHVYLPGIGVINGMTAGNYLDSAGTTAATVDNPVGLVLDGAGVLSADKFNSVTQFQTDLGWTNLGNGVYSYVDPGSGNRNLFETVFESTAGKVYRVKVTASALGFRAQFGGLVTKMLAIGDNEFNLTAQGVDVFVINASAATAGTVSNISVKEVTGIHALQATTANKPILRRGAVNLLTYSERFDNEAWTKDGTVTPNVATAPDGTLTADRFTPGTTGNAPIQTSANNNRIFQNIAGFFAGVVFNGSIYIKTDVINTAFTVYLVYSGSDTVATSVSGTTTGTWTRITVPSAATITNGMRLVLSSTEACLIWGAQLEVGSTASTYIPTTTAAASSSTGNYWWQFDGSNDSLALGSVPFQMADDHCVIAGANPDLRNIRAVFGIGAATGQRVALLYADGTWRFRYVDNAALVYEIVSLSVATLNATSILSGRKVSNTRILRVNGVTQNTDSTAIGATTVSLAQIGSSGHSSAFFSGGIYPVIAIKGTVSDADLLVLEKFVGSLSGVNVP